MVGYDVIFLGRIHHQKGVLELMDIWKHMEGYSLVVVGDGSLKDKCIEKASGNTTFVGDKYGKELDDIIKNCKVSVHPAVYDSGGMALARCMSFGLPGVSFDLDALKTYYPSGVVKVPKFNKELFAKEIIRLLEDKSHYETMSKQALELIETKWKWEARSKEIWNDMMSCLYHRQAEV